MSSESATERILNEPSPLDNVDKIMLFLQVGESPAPSQDCKRLLPMMLCWNIICTVRASDKESVGEYDRPGVSELGFSVIT